MRLLMIRHGNTFSATDKVVWVGSTTDMPLVSEGYAQAEAVGEALARKLTHVDRFVTGPLLRTKQTARIIASKFGLDELLVKIAQELREINYGEWEGKTNAEIKSLFGSEDIDNWQKRSIWPSAYNWAPSEHQIARDWETLIRNCVEEFPDGIVILVSSNGIFRIAAKMYEITPDLAKMNTGHISEIEFDSERFSVKFWNKSPTEYLIR